MMTVGFYVSTVSTIVSSLLFYAHYKHPVYIYLLMARPFHNAHFLAAGSQLLEAAKNKHGPINWNTFWRCGVQRSVDWPTPWVLQEQSTKAWPWVFHPHQIVTLNLSRMVPSLNAVREQTWKLSANRNIFRLTPSKFGGKTRTGQTQGNRKQLSQLREPIWGPCPWRHEAYWACQFESHQRTKTQACGEKLPVASMVIPTSKTNLNGVACLCLEIRERLIWDVSWRKLFHAVSISIYLAT